MWLFVRCVFFGICVFLMMQGLMDLLGIAKSVPSVGAIVAGILSIPNWRFIERELRIGKQRHTKINESKEERSWCGHCACQSCYEARIRDGNINL